MSTKTAPQEIEEQELDSDQQNFAELDQIIAANKGQVGVLINVLHQAQQLYGYLPREVQLRIAEKLEVPFSKVYSVVSFYSLFSTELQGEKTIEVCTGTACYVKGAADVVSKLESELGITAGDTTEDGLFTLKTTRCVGVCSLAPVVLIEDDMHGDVEIDKTAELLDEYK